MNDPITAYVDEVAHHLKARGSARRQALSDLAAGLRETAAAMPEPDAATAAVRAFGSARAYATELDAELETDRPRTIFGIPNSLAPGMLERMAATFDPEDERVIIPHVFGIGWAVNFGAVAARLGLLNPDDLDDELLTDAANGPGAVPRAVAWASLGAVVLAARAAHLKRRAAGMSGSEALVDLPGAVVVVALGSALAAAGSSGRLPPRQRLVAPAYATVFAAVTAADLAAVRRDGSKSRSAGGWGLAGGTALWFASTYGPVRAAVLRRVGAPRDATDSLTEP